MNMKIDDDLIASFSNLVLKSFEVNIEYVITSKHFSDILNLLINSQENICITFESKMFNERESSLIKRWLIENVASVF